MVGLKIASYTYGGLLGLFLLSKHRQNFHPASLVQDCLRAWPRYFFLDSATPIAWTWFILISVAVNIPAVFFIDASSEPSDAEQLSFLTRVSLH